MGVHPADAHGPGTPPGTQQLSIMCDDIGATLDELRNKGLEVTSEPNDEGFGITAFVGLPGGVQMMVYEPRHPSPLTGTDAGADTVEDVPRYTPPSDDHDESPLRRRPLSVRIGVWVLLVGVVALVFADVFAALL